MVPHLSPPVSSLQDFMEQLVTFNKDEVGLLTEVKDPGHPKTPRNSIAKTRQDMTRQL